MRIMFNPMAHETRKHPVVIAFQEHPVAPCIAPCDQRVDHATAVRPPIGVIAKKHDPRIGPTIRSDQGKRVIQHIKLAVKIADCIEGSQKCTFKSKKGVQ